MRGDIAEYAVSRAEAGRTLQAFLSERGALSRRLAKNVIDGRSVWVNRKCVWMAHHVLTTGDVVSVARAVLSAARRKAPVSAADAERPAAARHLRILVETPDYVVIDKPAGVLSCAEGEEVARVPSAEALLRVQMKLPGLEAVHRLDRDTTGCLLFAKTHAAFLAAVEVFKTKRVKKVYFAIAAGRFPHPHETIAAPLDGKPAVSHVSREASTADASFLKIRIETGRTNQIRRHLAGIRFPVIGDRMYGLKTARDARLMAVRRQMLHAADLELPDPTHRVRDGIRAHAPLPADFREVLGVFGMGKGGGRPRKTFARNGNVQGKTGKTRERKRS